MGGGGDAVFLLGPKKVSFIPSWWENFPNLEIWQNSDWIFLKEALKTEHFLNVSRPRIRSECFSKKQNSNLTKFWMFGDRYCTFHTLKLFPIFYFTCEYSQFRWPWPHSQSAEKEHWDGTERNLSKVPKSVMHVIRGRTDSSYYNIL